VRRRTYAEHTEVPIDRSKGEIERILTRYGAAGFGYMTKGNHAAVMFLANGKQLRFILPLPIRADVELTSKGRRRKAKVILEELERENRRRWRALALDIKAKLEAVETGITVFEQEFLPHIVLPNGQTVAEVVLPGIEEAYRTGKVTALLPGW
jgi:hypothetical protein